MPAVLRRINFTAPRERDFYSYGAACRFSQLCSAARTKTSGGPGQKTSPELREWLRAPAGASKGMSKSKSGKKTCEMNCGNGSETFSQTRCKMASKLIGSPTHS